MKKAKIIYLGIFLLTISIGIIGIYYLNKTVFAEPSLKTSKNPCWFKGYNDPSVSYAEIDARQKREMYGYSVDVPLETAVKKFNEEMRCYSQYDEFPELTEDEVIAALIDFDSLNNQPNYSEAKREERKKIVSNRILPKGALLQFNMGTCQDIGYFSNDLCAKGLKIRLIFNLDKNDDGKYRYLDEDVFVVRKIFLGVKSRK